MKCHYCATFATTPKSLRRIDHISTKTKVHYRYCRLTHNEVTADTDMCSELTPAPYFWCKKWNGWIHVIVCIVKRKSKADPCYYCNQYSEIEYVSVGRDMFALFNQERRPIKMAKVYTNPDTGEPVLRRRKMN